MDTTTDSAPRHSRLRLQLGLLAAAAALLVGAIAVGVADNPPGILLAFASSVALVLACAVTLRTRRHFELLLLWSLVAMVGAGVLHGAFEAAASTAGAAWLKAAGEAVGAALFLAAILLCPAGVVVGVAGIVVKAIGKRPS